MSDKITRVENQSPSRLTHMAFLDGFRGLAALWVVIGHTLGEYDAVLKERYTATDVAHFNAVKPFLAWLYHPIDAVAVFIVLSGFCLALPIMKSPDFQIRGGFSNYIKRRALRILPG